MSTSTAIFGCTKYLQYFVKRSTCISKILTYNNQHCHQPRSCSLWRVKKSEDFQNVYMPYSCRSMAGHSKWQNIKNIKAAKDGEKSKVNLAYTKKIKTVIQVSGNPDPKFNSRLASVINDAKSKNIPNSTIELAIQQAVKSKNNTSSAIYEAKGPGGSWFIIEATTDKVSMTKQQLQSIFKRNGGMVGETNCARHAFNHTGLIEVGLTETEVDMDKYIDVAIETGAEDVSLQADDDNNKYLEFHCAPDQVGRVHNKLVERGLDVQSASEEYIPSNVYTPSTLEFEAIKKLVLKIEKDIPEVERIHDNVQPPDS